MRKDNFVRKKLSTVYAVYLLRGLNLDRFINLVVSRGVPLFNVRKKGNKQITFCVNIEENKNFFAIINKLWYNNTRFTLTDGQTANLNGSYTLKRIRTGGLLAPLYALYKRVGLILGGLLFIITAVYFSDVVFSVDYSGSGYALKNDVQEYLLQNGVGRFSRFSKVDLNALADGVLAQNPSLSFVSCQKRGNRLLICLERAVTPPHVLQDDATQLVSTVDGVIEQIKVYRGTPLLSEGDTVKTGDVIVDGFLTWGEDRLQVTVLASVVVVSDFVFEYCDSDASCQDLAVLYARQALGDKNIIETLLTKTPYGKQTKYTVTLRYRTLITTG